MDWPFTHCQASAEWPSVSSRNWRWRPAGQWAHSDFARGRCPDQRTSWLHSVGKLLARVVSFLHDRIVPALNKSSGFTIFLWWKLGCGVGAWPWWVVNNFVGTLLITLIISWTRLQRVVSDPRGRLVYIESELRGRDVAVWNSTAGHTVLLPSNGVQPATWAEWEGSCVLRAEYVPASQSSWVHLGWLGHQEKRQFPVGYSGPHRELLDGTVEGMESVNEKRWWSSHLKSGEGPGNQPWLGSSVG